MDTEQWLKSRQRNDEGNRNRLVQSWRTYSLHLADISETDLNYKGKKRPFVQVLRKIVRYS